MPRPARFLPPFLAFALLVLPRPALADEKTDEVPKLPAKPITRLEGFPDKVVSVAFSPDGKWLVAGTFGELRFYAAEEGYPQKKKVPCPSGDARSLAFSHDGSLLAVGYYQGVSLYSFPDMVEQPLPGDPLGYVTGVAFNHDDSLLATSTEGEKVRLYSVADKSVVRELTGHAFPVMGVAFSPDGKLLASVAGDENRVTQPGEVKLWNPETGDELATLVEHERAAFSCAFSKNGKMLVTTGLDEKCNVYDVESRKPLGFFADHGRPVNSALFAAEDRAVVSGAGGRSKGKNDVLIWKTASGDELGKISAHEQKINAVALHSDGRTLAIASADKTVSLWDLAGPLSGLVEAKAVVATTETKADPNVIRVGIIGLDTSHAVAFTKAINAEKPREEFVGFRIVAAYPQGSPDIASSTSRVPGYTEEVKKHGVEIVDSIEALCEKVDAILLETNDGRPHLEQLIPCLKAGKPVFIDKPIAGDLVDTIAIFEASKKFGVPVFSSSSLRYVPGAQELRSGKIGKIFGCDAYSPAALEATHPDLYWYGIHGVETLFTVMGPGCQSVTRASTPGIDVVTGVWAEGRVGTFRGIRTGKSGYGGTAFGEQGVEQIGGFAGYEVLLVEVVKFFKTKQPPVDPVETLEIYAFMSAADESKRRGGAPVTLAEMIEQAKPLAAERLKALLGE